LQKKFTRTKKKTSIIVTKKESALVVVYKL